MRILYLCHRIPYPPNKGDKIRAFHQLRAIAAQHEVDLFTLADEAVDPAHVAALEQFCHQVTIVPLNPRLARLRALPFIFTGTPLTLPYFYSRKLATEIRKAVQLRSYDRILVYCSAMAQYVERFDQIPALLDLVDVDSDKWTQYAAFAPFPFSAVYRREGARLREYEREACERCSRVLVSTEREAELVRQLSETARVQVIQNGVDTDYFAENLVPREAATPTLIFTGDMSYFPNEEAVIYFAREVLPVIHRSVPDARFLVVGRDPGRRVRQLEKLSGVKVTGFVPDVRCYLAKAQVSVAPFSIAAGIQNKILEAMAYGLPVIATSRAVRGLSKAVAEIVMTGESVEELASHGVRLLSDAELARRLGSEGRRRVAADYNWGQAHDRLLQAIEDLETKDVLGTEPHPAARCGVT